MFKVAQAPRWFAMAAAVFVVVQGAACVFEQTTGVPHVILGSGEGEGEWNGNWPDAGEGEGEGEGEVDPPVPDHECRIVDDCVPPPPTNCQDDPNNPGTQVCDPPLPANCQSENDPPRCGVLHNPPDECDDVTPCADAGHCHAVGPHDCTLGFNQCKPACLSNSDCDVRETCTDTGDCVPTACVLDADCPSTRTCVPGGDGADANGCALRTCTVDSDCVGSDVCVEQQCASTFGQCVFGFIR